MANKEVPFSIPSGVVRGSTNRMSPGRWISSNGIRFSQGVMQPLRGWSRMTSTALAGVPRVVMGWNSNGDFKYYGVHTTTNIYYMLGSDVIDITPSDYVPPETSTEGGYSTGAFSAEDYGDARSGVPPTFQRPALLTMDSWGDMMVCCSSSDGRLFRFDPADVLATTAIPITGDAVPISNRAVLVSPERHMIVLCADGNSRRVQWCSREDFSTWTATATNTAGYLDLDTHGQLTALGTVKDGTLLWADSGDLFRMRYLGAPLVHGVDKIMEGASPILSPYAHCEFQGKSFWVSREGMNIYEGGVAQPVPCSLLDFFHQDIDPVQGRRNTVCVLNHLHDEIFIFYTSKDSPNGENDKALVWNFTENHWAMHHSISRSCGVPALINDKPVWASSDGHLWEHEQDNFTAYNSAGINPGDIYAETGALAPANGQIVQVTKIRSDSDLIASATKWTFYTRMTPEGEETALEYAPRPDGVIDVRFLCRDVRIRISQNADLHWTMGTPSATYKPRGER